MSRKKSNDFCYNIAARFIHISLIKYECVNFEFSRTRSRIAERNKMTKQNKISFISILLTLCCFVLQPASLFSQGIIRKLPAPGKWIRYEGTFEQIDIRSQQNQTNITTKWDRHLILKCLGEEVQASYNEEMVPCQWIELKVITGKASEGGIDPGPVGARIYKVLIPKSKINAKVKDEKGIRNAFLPIVKGYQKIGDGEVKVMTTKVLQIYPLISNLMHYRKLVDGGEEALDLPIGENITTKKETGTMIIESQFSKSINKADMWVSDTAPFGLAKCTVKVERFSKDSVTPRSEFQPVTEISVEMSASEIGDDAESEIIIPE